MEPNERSSYYCMYCCQIFLHLASLIVIDGQVFDKRGYQAIVEFEKLAENAKEISINGERFDTNAGIRAQIFLEGTGYCLQHLGIALNYSRERRVDNWPR